MTPKMFGGDVARGLESFQKSLAIDPLQDEAWMWLAKAFQKQGNKAKALEAVQRSLQLNPESAFAKATASELQR
jgi:Tfp pilus assembly protein PilF